MDRVIAVDFDGTVVTHKYPEVGEDVPFACEVLSRLINADVKIILWTMRSGEYLDEAVEWFKSKGIELWGVNENPEQKEWTDSPKAYARLYIDDAAVGCPLLPTAGRPMVNWQEVEKFLEVRGWLETVSAVTA